MVLHQQFHNNVYFHHLCQPNTTVKIIKYIDLNEKKISFIINN